LCVSNGEEEKGRVKGTNHCEGNKSLTMWCRMKEETWGRSNFNNTASSSPSSLSSCCVLFSETHTPSLSKS